MGEPEVFMYIIFELFHEEEIVVDVVEWNNEGGGLRV